MRTTRIALLLSTGFSLVAIACAAPTTGSEAKRERASSIISGTESTADDDAVVLLPMAGSFCTGTLIAPNLVLTARHCVSDPGPEECSPFGADKPASAIGVSLGAQPSSEAQVAKGKQLFVEPNATICGKDIALILLDKDVPNIKPRAVRLTPPVVGELTTAVGYGEDENKEITGRKLRSGIPVQAVGPTTRTATANGQTVQLNIPANDFATGESVCHGDSGGPLFDAKGAVLGTTSRGTELGCLGAPALFSSNAAHADLIKTALAAAGHPLTTTTTTDAGTDSGTPAADAGMPGTADAGTTSTPDQVGDAPGKETKPSTDADDSADTTDEDESDDKPTKTTKPKPKSKSKTGSSAAATPGAYGCSASPRTFGSAALTPFLLALAAFAIRRRRRSAGR